MAPEGTCLFKNKQSVKENRVKQEHSGHPTAALQETGSTLPKLYSQIIHLSRHSNQTMPFLKQGWHRPTDTPGEEHLWHIGIPYIFIERLACSATWMHDLHV